MAIITERYEDAGDFFGLRQEFRKRNLDRVRREFRLPAPEIVDGRSIYKDAEGREHPWFQSKRQEAGMDEVEEFWGGQVIITNLDMAEDGVHISAESRDLERDIHNLVRSETVSHGVQQDHEFVIGHLDDEEVDRSLQEYIKSHE